MKRNNGKRFVGLVSLVVIFSFLLPLVVLGQTDAKSEKERIKQEKKRQDAEEKARKKGKQDEDKLNKQIKKYDEALSKANEKYRSDEDFRAAVDIEYRRIQREHARLAFEMNTVDSNDEVLTNTGDKIPRNSDTLYDNLLAQNYVNRLGQSLVPQKSENRFGFKVTLNPMPDARSLSTGTVYVSTGLLSLVDNEAQLAYILSHEIAHIEKDHWKQDVKVALYIQEESRKQEQRTGLIGLGVGILAGGLGGKSVGSAINGALFGASIARFITKLVSNRAFEWTLAQEDEADKLALQYMLDRNYDVNEANNFYTTIKDAAVEDPRLELDRFADRGRAEERSRAVNAWIKSSPTAALGKRLIGAANFRGKSLSLDRNTSVVVNRINETVNKFDSTLQEKLNKGELMAGDGEFEDIMAMLKRDNGIVAFYYDMYKLAYRNLDQALAVRSDDALGLFYLGKVLSLTARKPGERELAQKVFQQAIELDKRGAIPQARLNLALSRLGGRSTVNASQIVLDLKSYVSLYQQVNGGQLPPNMSVIYDFLRQSGEPNWSLNPVTLTRPEPTVTPTPTPTRGPTPKTSPTRRTD